jgi:hypothetical protein
MSRHLALRCHSLGFVVLGALGCLLGVSPAGALERDPRIEALEVQRTDPAEVRTPAGQWKLTRDDERWDGFASGRGPGWQVRWNEVAGSPHRVFGASLPASTFGLPAPAGEHDKDAVLRLAEAFVRSEGELLGTRWEDLRPLYAAFRGGRWVVTLQQEARGTEVVGGRVDLRFGTERRIDALRCRCVSDSGHERAAHRCNARHRSSADGLVRGGARHR